MAGTSRQYDYEEVFDYIVKFKQEHDGVSPTLQEIMTEVGIPSKNTISYILDRLEKDGWIELEGGARMIKVIGGAWTYTDTRKEGK